MKILIKIFSFIKIIEEYSILIEFMIFIFFISGFIKSDLGDRFFFVHFYNREYLLLEYVESVRNETITTQIHHTVSFTVLFNDFKCLILCRDSFCLPPSPVQM